jgi:hypothetical protein
MRVHISWRARDGRFPKKQSRERVSSSAISGETAALCNWVHKQKGLAQFEPHKHGSIVRLPGGTTDRVPRDSISNIRESGQEQASHGVCGEPPPRCIAPATC